ncbi:Carboxypeptidase regulatory-like domain-containing protein [Granulicella rosea]|uniref:Carboxypeptidase regulatory-like domain-containing protein n=1 Tax=Granulicella rosea TaxID=474952 RepID=A0A239LCT2_9BACT|nr:carboxypeptidase-like regulatory domain-containing protein [Granulicella rosea]SNT28271.1 Carboxypeptidase regulatory-like domain-containing protein [Granulicella rosea]
MGSDDSQRRHSKLLSLIVVGAALLGASASPGQAQSPNGAPAASLPQAPEPQGTAIISGSVTDTQQAIIPGAKVTLEDVATKVTRTIESDSTGAFRFESIAPGQYVVHVAAVNFAPWKIRDVIVLHEGENFAMPVVELGVEEINTTVNAITQEDLAEQQITAEMHQRILGVLPNFYVIYEPHAAPLTRKQKFKLAARVSTDPLTFMTTGITAGIETAQGGFSDYGEGVPGYLKRYGAAYGDRLSSTMLGAALFPSLLHQDPRYFYRGHGRIVTRALYAISTTVICKGDNGKWQPNVSNVAGNLGAAFISSTYYPRDQRHSVQVTVDNTLIGVATGAIGTLFQEFLLKHVTHGVPPKPLP